MNKTKKQKLLNKIKNLLDLADSKNSRHEAEAAAKKAQALIMKYNIDEAKLHEGDIASVEQEKYPLYKDLIANEGTWLRNLYWTVARYNFCKVIYWKHSHPDNWDKRVDSVYIIGEANNVELVKYLSKQLMHRLRSIEKKHWDEYEGLDSRNVYRRGFLKGAVRGLDAKFHEQWREFKTDESTALVISKKNEAVEKFVEKEFPNLGTARSGSTSSSAGYSAGRKAGRNVNISAGLRGKGGSRLLN